MGTRGNRSHQEFLLRNAAGESAVVARGRRPDTFSGPYPVQVSARHSMYGVVRSESMAALTSSTSLGVPHRCAGRPPPTPAAYFYWSCIFLDSLLLVSCIPIYSQYLRLPLITRAPGFWMPNQDPKESYKRDLTALQ